MRWAAVLVVAACSGGGTRAAEAPVCPVCASPPDAGGVPLPEPVVGEAPPAIEWPSVDALVLEGAAGSPWRARRVIWGPTWLDPSSRDEAEAAMSRRGFLDEPDVLAVAEVRGTEVRVLIEISYARYLAWIAGTDLDKVVTEPFESSDGVRDSVLLPGLPVEWVPDGDDEVAVRVAEGGLAFDENLPVTSIGEVWLEPDAAPIANAVIKAGTDVRNMADTGAYPVFTTSRPLLVRRLSGAEAGYVEVESVGRIGWTGWVPKKSLRKYSPPRERANQTIFTCRKNLDVIAGACLYDRVDGDVIGVQTADAATCAQDLGDGWWTLNGYDTDPLVHAVDAGGDELEFDICVAE